MYYRIQVTKSYSNRFGWSSKPEIHISEVFASDMLKENHMLVIDLDDRPVGMPKLTFLNSNGGTSTERYYMKVPNGTSTEEVKELFNKYIEEQ